MSEFLNESKDVANQFIKNILFVDDQIKWEEHEEGVNPQSLNARTLIKGFAKQKKSCSFYSIEDEDYNLDKETILNIIPNSDVIVLDWRTIHDSAIIQEGESEEEDDDDESDMPDNTGRGKFTLSILENLVAQFQDSLKLILILTGDYDSEEILTSIRQNTEFANFHVDETNLTLVYQKVKISIYFKPDISGQHLPANVRNKIIAYENLPEIINEEFASFTGGLISNTALKTISVIRDNASKLLKIYQKELDPAYLGHRVLLEVPENAEDLLRETILHSIINLINTNQISDKCDMESIEKWIFSTPSFKNSSISISNNSINLAGTHPRRVLLKEGFINGTKKLWTEQGQQGNPSKNAVEKLWSKSINYFIPTDNNHSNINEEFAILTHHKEYFNEPLFIPRLTLGTVIKKNIDNLDYYFICIQPQCNAVRIKEKDKNNNFLFLPLKENKEARKTKIVVKKNDGTFLKLKPVYDANFVKIITFKLTDGIDFIKSSENKFTAIEGGVEQKYTWVLDLKDNHAQRIANEFGAQITRVGLDESEWLRRS